MRHTKTMAIASTNPADGKIWKTFDPLSASQIDQKLALATNTFAFYRRAPFSQKSTWMRRAAEILDNDVERLARIMTSEMGKPIQAARDEAIKCATGCRFYAEHAERFLQEEI